MNNSRSETDTGTTNTTNSIEQVDSPTRGVPVSRRKALAIGGTAASSYLAGCLGGSDVETVKFGTVTAAAVAEVFIADEHGYFEDRNIELDIERIDSLATATPQLASGNMDVATGGLGASTFNSIAEGVEIKIVADQTQWWTEQPSGNRVLVRDELYTEGMSFSDLSEPTVAFFPEGGNLEYLCGRLLQTSGMDWDDIDISRIPFQDMLAAMEAAEIDVCMIFDPLALNIMDETGAQHLLYGSQLAPRGQIGVYAFGGPFMDDDPGVAVDWLEAYLLGVREYYDMGGFPDERVASIISEALEIPEGAIQSSIPSLPHRNGRVNDDSVMSQQAFHACRGYVDTTVEREDVIDESLLDEALESVGRLDEDEARPSAETIEQWGENAPRPYIPVGETIAPENFPDESLCE